MQDVLADKPGAEVAVLDQDTEGADQDEIVEIADESVSLCGTLQTHEVRVAPVLIASAYR